MAAETSKTLVAGFIERIWNEGAVADVGRFVASAYTVLHDPGDPWDGRTLDRAGFAERVVRSRAPFPDQRFEIVDLLGEGDRVALSWLWSATHLGDIPDFPATGRRIAMSGLTIYRTTPEGLDGHWQVSDRLGVYRQLLSNRAGTA
ncbi:ester cyclase [Amaricoccus solimangrovi]|uniref:Ester cyclase n=1 Tax=Amaricoccus solimangrovi TaxID=2589815 RepID=A0A501WJ72_9RHOB|nr:ester cyclase [Amaricoccus solimangrovi]TPE49398.1 ester cyclase [Amaricoccus solimangrovi]